MTTKNSNSNSGGVLESMEAGAARLAAAVLAADVEAIREAESLENVEAIREEAGKPCGSNCLVKHIGPEADGKAVRQYIGSVLRAVAPLAGSPAGSGAEALPEAAELVPVDMNGAETSPDAMPEKPAKWSKDGGPEDITEEDIYKAGPIKTMNFFNWIDNGSPAATEIKRQGAQEFKRMGLEEEARKIEVDIEEEDHRRKVDGLYIMRTETKTTYAISPDTEAEIAEMIENGQLLEAEELRKQAEEEARMLAEENEDARTDTDTTPGIFAECMTAAWEEISFLMDNREAVEVLDDCCLRREKDLFLRFNIGWNEKLKKPVRAGAGAWVTKAIGREYHKLTDKNRSRLVDPSSWIDTEKERPAVFSQVVNLEERDALRAAAERVSKKAQDVVFLREAGYNRTERAAILGISPEAETNICCKIKAEYKKM